MTPDRILAEAARRYPEDYDDDVERLFVWLVDAADGAERALAAVGHPTPRLAVFKALAAALQAREGDACGGPDTDVLGLPLRDVAVGALPPGFDELVEVAACYEWHLAAEQGNRMLEPPTDTPQTLSEAALLTPRRAMLLGLLDNLEIRDGER